MKVKHEAFLDLEEGLEAKLVPVWNRYWSKYAKQLADAAEAGDYSRAHQLAQEASMASVVEQKQALLRTLGMSALLLGASRVQDLKASAVKATPPKDLLAHGIAQTEDLLADTGTVALRQQLHDWLDRQEYALAADNSATLSDVEKGDVLPLDHVLALGVNHGRQVIGLASSLQVSRLSTAGFMLEATAVGQEIFMISAVMDKHTCFACEKMDGQTFPVSAGLSRVTAALSARGTAALKAVAPFIDQSKAGRARLSRMSGSDLMDAGIMLPPYHPRCRCVTVPTGDTLDAAGALDATLSAAAGAALAHRLLGPDADPEGAYEAAEAVSDGLSPGTDTSAAFLAGLLGVSTGSDR